MRRQRTLIGIGVELYSNYGPAQCLYAKLGFGPDGHGVTCKDELAGPGVTLEDIVLWMTKSLVAK